MTSRRPMCAGEMPGKLGVQPGQEEQPMPVEPMGYPVEEDGVDAGVQQKDLQLGAGGRVPPLIGAQQLG